MANDTLVDDPTFYLVTVSHPHWDHSVISIIKFTIWILRIQTSNFTPKVYEVPKIK